MNRIPVEIFIKILIQNDPLNSLKMLIEIKIRTPAFSYFYFLGLSSETLISQLEYMLRLQGKYVRTALPLQKLITAFLNSDITLLVVVVCLVVPLS